MDTNTPKGFSITTRRFHLRCRHPEWLRLTQDLYNGVQLFYYDLLLSHPGLWEAGGQRALRELELLSIPGRDGRTPQCPLPWERVPLYFRRAAANAGIAAARSFLARDKRFPGKRAEAFHSAVVYYKGMYRELSASSVTLRVYDGEGWRWLRCRLYGDTLPEGGQALSPSVVFSYKYVMLHVPVREETGDASGIRERMERGGDICSLQFTNGECFAMAAILDREGKQRAVRFFGGGREYAHRYGQLAEKIRRNAGPEGESAGRKYREHLEDLCEYHAHRVSREIVEFCREYGAAVLVAPKYGEGYSRYVMYASGNGSALRLSLRIRRYLGYKAWKAGMAVWEESAAGTSRVCAVCGEEVVRVDRVREEYTCRGGHRGNRHLNTALNLGRKYLGEYGRE